MSDSVIANSIVIASVSVALAYLAKEANKSVPIDNQNQYTLRISKLYIYLGIVGMLCAMIFVIAATVYNELDSVLIIGIIVMTLFMGIPSFIVLLLYTKCRVSFNETSFQVTNLYGKTKSAKWNDVVGMKLNSFTNFYTLTLYNGDKIKISQHLVGLKIFLDFLNRGSNK